MTADMLMSQELIALLIFILTYLLFLSGMMNKTVAALLGAMLMVMFGVLSYNEIGMYLDIKTLTVALGMMVVVNVVNRSGLFEYLSIKTIKLTRGDPLKILIMLSLLALPITAFFDNITTALILGSLIITVCKILNLDFVPYLISISIIVNIGSILTPVASLPNMMITTNAGFGFLPFMLYILPLGIIFLVTTLLFFRYQIGKSLKKRIRKTSREELESLNENKAIKDKVLFKRSLVILSFIILAFLIHDRLHVGVEAIALTGAIVMLVLSSADPETILSEVHWSTLAFLVGIFIVVGGVNKVGLLDRFSLMLAQIGKAELSAVMVILGSSAATTTVLNSIPVTAVFIPIVQELAAKISVNPSSLFYALVVAVGLGGNITPIGSASTIITTGIAEKHGRTISFSHYFKIGFVLTLVHLAVSALYFVIRISILK